MNNKITEGVGKKIVEALKQQSDIEIQNVVDNPVPAVNEEPVTVNEETLEFTTNDDMTLQNSNYSFDDEISNDVPHDMSYSNDIHPYTNTMTFTQPAPPITEKESYTNDLEGFEIPTNIAILKQLINQLPAGVSKQTGAQIIRQTMEALGISMKSVLQEAQQVQESLNNSSRECQASIMEYRKQISVLEKQAQKFQRQYSSLNDIISLFIQTGI